MTITVYNMVGSDGSWFSPYGWRTRALLLAKKVPVTWVDLRVSQMREALAFADTSTTPLLVDESGDKKLVLTSGWAIAEHIDTRYPEPRVFTETNRPGVALLHRLVDDACQIPGFAAWSANYFSDGVMTGADADIFRTIVERATGRTVEENAARQGELISEFRRRLHSFEAQLEELPWILGDFSYADITLFSCLKCFATVLRGIEGVLGTDDRFPRLAEWYRRMHETCFIDDPY